MRPPDWQDGLRSVLPEGEVASQRSVRLDPHARQVAVARRFVVEDTADLGEDQRDTLALLTSELVTNAVIHARTEIVLAVTVLQEAVVVTVHDLDLGRTEDTEHARDGGRGLAMVAALSCASGQHRHPWGGKTSWFRLCLSGSCSDDDPGTTP